MRYFVAKQRLCRIKPFHSGMCGERAAWSHARERNDEYRHNSKYREPPWLDAFAIFPHWRDSRPSSP